MSTQTVAFLFVITLMISNQLVMRVGALRSRPLFFWGLQLINVVGGTGILVLGLPGWEQYPVVSWLLGLLFIFRTVQNNMLRSQFLKEKAALAERDRKKQARELRDALHAEPEAEES